MKKLLTILSGLFVAGMLLTACDKYESSISGTITYINEDDGITYPADYALVTKMAVEGDSLRPMVAVRTNTNGEYLHEHNTKGTWKLNVTFEKDSVIYVGLSEEFTTNGLDKIEQNILLKALKVDTTFIDRPTVTH